MFRTFFVSCIAALLVGTLYGHQPRTIACNFGELTTCTNQITTIIGEPVLLESVTYDCDVALSEQEFSYSTNLCSGMLLSAHDLSNALLYLGKKNKFECALITIAPGVTGITIHFKLTAFWTLAQVTFKGFMIGRDRYRQYYLIEPTEHFDERKHHHSLEQMRQAFYQEGYYDARVESDFVYHDATKSVAVTIRLARGDQFRIGDIRVLCNDQQGPVDPTSSVHISIADFIHKRLGTRYYGQQLLNKETANLKHYLVRKGFLYASIGLQEQIDHDEHTIHLTFSIDLLQAKECSFFGNHYFSDAQLVQHLLCFGYSANFLPATVISDEITNMYHKKGFLDVSVQVQEQKDALLCLIQEGVRLRVTYIYIHGTQAYDRKALVKEWCMPILKNKGSFDADRVQSCIEKIRAMYIDHGFWQVAIDGMYYEPTGDGTTHTLHMTVHEGPRSTITALTLDAPYGELAQSDPLIGCIGKPFEMQSLHEQRTFLLKSIEQQGHQLVSIKPVLTRNDDAVEVHWQMQTRTEKNRFGKTVLVDSIAFPYEKIMRELTYKEGDPFDQDQLKQSLMRLKNLDVFESIQLTPFLTSAEDSDRPIMLKLQKNDPYEIRLRAGLGLQQMSTAFTFRAITYVFGGTALVRNPGNCGDQLRCEVDYKRGMHSVVGSYRRPWIFGTPMGGLFQVYSVHYLQPGWIETQRNLYDVTQNGFLFGLNHKAVHTNIGGNAGIEWMETRATGDCSDDQFFNQSLARALNFEPQLLDRNIPYFMCEPTLLIDYTDNRAQPTKGTFTLLTMKAMLPLSYRSITSSFVRLYVEQSVFLPINPVVFSFRIRFGHVFQNNFSSIMPSERFYLGGANSIRSYQTDSCPPLGTYVNAQGEKVFIPQGAKSMLNLNGEVNFPIYGRIGGALFQDLGLLNNNLFTDIKAHDWLAGTGAGLRYNTPIGPLRFDLAWKWRREDKAISRIAWYLTFGSAF